VSIWGTVYDAAHYYVPATPATGPSTPTDTGGVTTTAPAPNGGSIYVPGGPYILPGGSDLGGSTYVQLPGAIITEPVESLGGGYYAAQPANGGPTCVRCAPPPNLNPPAGVPTPRPGTPAAPTTTTTTFAKLAGLPWWVWVLGLVAAASAFADRK